MELVGILVIIVGFALKLDTIAVVVAAGLTTGLVAHMSIGDILNTLGEAFVTNRTTCLFMLTVPISKQFINRNIIKWRHIDKRSYNSNGSYTWWTPTIC